MTTEENKRSILPTNEAELENQINEALCVAGRLRTQMAEADAEISIIPGIAVLCAIRENILNLSDFPSDGAVDLLESALGRGVWDISDEEGDALLDLFYSAYNWWALRTAEPAE